MKRKQWKCGCGFEAETSAVYDAKICPKCGSKMEGQLKQVGLAALTTLTHFIGPSQRHAVLVAMRGEERQWFADKLAELARIVETMPKTGGTDGQGDAAVAHLHYFAGGVGDWYITEKDAGDARDPIAGEQLQAFGLADPFRDGGEVGYISISEMLDNGVELDFHWTPKSLRDIRERQEVAV